jgi:hypothetical protein
VVNLKLFASATVLTAPLVPFEHLPENIAFSSAPRLFRGVRVIAGDGPAIESVTRRVAFPAVPV